MPKPLRLVLLSCLMLFVELALIRWTGSNVVYLSYFSNFVLLGSFLGIGIGFLRGRAKVNLFPYAPVALTFLVGLVLIFPVRIDTLRLRPHLLRRLQQPSGLPLWVTLPFIFVAVAGVMAMIAEGVARTFVEFEPLEAYRYDIAGSHPGHRGLQRPRLHLGAAGGLGRRRAPSCSWSCSGRSMRVLQAVALIGLVFMLGRESIVPEWSWSPYYKVKTTVVAARTTRTASRSTSTAFRTSRPWPWRCGAQRNRRVLHPLRARARSDRWTTS